MPAMLGAPIHLFGEGRRRQLARRGGVTLADTPEWADLEKDEEKMNMLMSVRRGKTRLAKWYAPYNDEEKIKLKGEVRTSIPPFPLST
jgi:hypothetical protein